MPLHIVADENMPLVEKKFRRLGTVVLRPGRALDAATVREADVLLVRSVTRVDAALVEGSALRFVGSATTGTDHVDEAALAARGIAFAHAPGANAESVVEYVLAALLHLARSRGTTLRGKTLALVGVGAIGGRLAERLPALGLRVRKNDPPLAARSSEGFVSLGTALAEADIVSLHVPLTADGAHATHHLFDDTVFERIKPGAWLLNTARGPVVESAALRRAIRASRLGATVLDVWENEPTPDPALLRAVDLGTPHIAGYSYDAKIAGTVRLYEALAAHLGLPEDTDSDEADESFALDPPDPTLSETAWLDALVRQMYDIAADDARLRTLLRLPPEDHAAYFAGLRKHYPRRRSFRRYTLPRHAVPPGLTAAVTDALSIQLT